MNQSRYDQVIKVCQLKRDFRLLPYGDKTIVGERGISLSGGQRARFSTFIYYFKLYIKKQNQLCIITFNNYYFFFFRINLARAVYSDAPIYAFDDPLSAVDAHVGKNMFEECIAKHLKNKTRILITHQLQYLDSVDRIVVLKDGQIEAQGY